MAFRDGFCGAVVYDWVLLHWNVTTLLGSQNLYQNACQQKFGCLPNQNVKQISWDKSVPSVLQYYALYPIFSMFLSENSQLHLQIMKLMARCGTTMFFVDIR